MKKKLVTLLLCIFCFSLTVGCDNKNASVAESENTVADASESENTTSDDSANEVKLPETESEKTEDTDYKDFYKDFMDGKTKALSKIDSNNLERGKEYDLNGIFDALSESLKADYFSNYALKNYSYAYLDLSNSGNMALLINANYIDMDGLDSDNTFDCILLADGPNLYICDVEYSYYRVYSSINKYGYIAKGGSTGASSYYFDYYIISPEGEKVFLYSECTEMGLNEPMIPCYYIDTEFLPEDYEDRYYTYDENKDYSELFNVTYYNTDDFEYDYDDEEEETDWDEYDRVLSLHNKQSFYFFTDFDENDVLPSDADKELYDSLDILYGGKEDAQKYISKVLEDNNVTEDIQSYMDTEYEETVTVMDESVENSADKYYIIRNTYDGYYFNEDYEKRSVEPIKVKEKSHENNDITDDYEWLAENGFENPYENSGINCNGYTLYMGGYSDNYGSTSVYYFDDNFKNMGEYDFTDFEYTANYDEVSNPFIEEYVHYAGISDDGKILYVSIGHNTYSADEPNNAFIIAIDTDTHEVIFRTDSLVSNASNFLIKGDCIFAGYGFTDEDDYLYCINRYTGETLYRTKMNKQISYIFEKDNELYIRTYDRNYIFEME